MTSATLPVAVASARRNSVPPTARANVKSGATSPTAGGAAAASETQENNRPASASFLSITTSHLFPSRPAHSFVIQALVDVGCRSIYSQTIKKHANKNPPRSHLETEAGKWGGVRAISYLAGVEKLASPSIT